MITQSKLVKMKQAKEKISCLSLYDASLAKLADQAGVEAILIGDSLSMVMQGNPDTTAATLEQMCYHTKCVARGADQALIIADMPFMSYSTMDRACRSAEKLMRSGAHMVKMEGGEWLAPIVEQLANQGVPVCGHLGCQPQSIHLYGGYKVAGKEADQAEAITNAALQLQEAGMKLLVLECIPNSLGKVITDQLDIPTIGIGAGVQTDGQVLVAYDLLGIGTENKPRFVKNFMPGADSVLQAFQAFVSEVRELKFPALEHTYP